MPTDCTEHLTNGDILDPVNFFLITAMTGKKIEKIVNKSKKYVVRLTINGVEVDFEHAMKRLMDNVDEEVKMKALEIATTKCSDIVDTLTRVNRTIKKTLMKRLGIKFNEEDWE